MEYAVSTTAQAPTRFALGRIDTRVLSTWVLACGVILYLACDGGGYSLSSHGQVGIVVWWVAVASAAWGLLPTTRFTRGALITIALFGAFTAWTALATTWSISVGRSLDDLALVTCYLGILVLGTSIHRERETAVRHTLYAVSTAITAVAILALASRLWPHLFPGATQTGQFLYGIRARLAWPLNYWNALATLMAVGLPLMLATATSARTLRAQAAAGAAIPVLALCDALTLSRGGLIEAAVAIAALLVLAPNRIPKLGTFAVTAAGSAIVIVAAFRRHDLQQGLVTPAEHHQALTLVAVIILVCAGVALAQFGLGMLTRHGTLPPLLTISVPRARKLTVAGAVAVIVIALAAGAPSRINHAWVQFKSPKTTVSQEATNRFASASGEGRYQFWQAAIDSAKPHPVTGSGPGTFQLDWLPRAPFEAYVTNAHSLYVETYAELGLVGLTLLLGFLIAALVVALRLALRSRDEQRTFGAAITGALLAFAVSAAFDWTWQVPVVPAAVLLLLGAALAPRRGGIQFATLARPPRRRARSGRDLTRQLAIVIAGLACLVATAFPLATGTAVSRSQQAAAKGNLYTALADARAATKLESGSAAAQLQLALVYEAQHSYHSAVEAAEHAVRDEPQNWTNWLTLSRVDAENGDAAGAVIAYRKAKTLNPQSTLFKSND